MSYSVITDEIKQGSFINERFANTMSMSFHMGQEDLTQKTVHANAQKSLLTYSLNEENASGWIVVDSD